MAAVEEEKVQVQVAQPTSENKQAIEKLEGERVQIQTELERARGLARGTTTGPTLEKLENMNVQMKLGMFKDYQTGVKNMVQRLHAPGVDPMEAIKEAIDAEDDDTVKQALGNVGVDIANGMQLTQNQNMYSDDFSTEMEAAYLMSLRELQYDSFFPPQLSSVPQVFRYSPPVYYK